MKKDFSCNPETNFNSLNTPKPILVLSVQSAIKTEYLSCEVHLTLIMQCLTIVSNLL